MDSIEDLILLNTVEGLGFKKLEKLLSVFKNTSRILKAGKSDLRAMDGINAVLAEKIVNLDHRYLSEELKSMERLGVRALSVFDDDYPENLKNIYSPPIVLYVKGKLRAEDRDAVAIIGTRRPSYYGISTCEKLAVRLAQNGLVIISGLARGIDTMAHKGALKAGRTIGVLGSGFSHIYPPENRNLADEICEKGALVSEFPVNTPPYRFNFPRRNRIISGLSLGVLIVEASQRSGSLITAGFALDENREVFAVPGRAGFSASRGTNNLIKHGAKLVEDSGDVMTEIENNLRYRNRLIHKKRGEKALTGDIKNLSLSNDERKIKSLLSYEPLYIDELAKKSKMNINKINALLLKLEFKSIARELPGKNFVLR